MNVFAGVGGDGLPDGCRVGVFLLGGRFPSVALAPPAGLGN